MLPTAWIKLQPRPAMSLSMQLRKSTRPRRPAPKMLAMEPRLRPKTPEKVSRPVQRKLEKALRTRLPSNRTTDYWKTRREQRCSQGVFVSSRARFFNLEANGLTLRRHRQGDVENCAAIRVVLRPEPPSVSFNDSS